MLNIVANLKPVVAGTVLLAASLFGASDRSCKPKECEKKPSCPQPTPPTQICGEGTPCCPAWPIPVLNAAYNYPARTLVRNAVDLSFDASFIFFQPVQDNMELGTQDGSVINMDNEYKPGFKVGMDIGFNYDNWDMQMEYTWFHETQSVSATGTGIGVYGTGTGYTSASKSWHLGMDIADVNVGRWNYNGTKLTFRPSLGLRGAWIRQQTNTQTNSVASVQANTNSWAIGPRAMLETNWIVYEGLRFYGNGGMDILYTRYTSLANQNGYGTLRTHLDLEIGAGYGFYFDCNKYFMDFSAGYGFQTFFNQNMFRQNIAGSTNNVSFMPNGDLYLQGLTIKAQLNF